MASGVAQIRPQATIRPEPGRVVVTHDDGEREVYPLALAREWLSAMEWAVERAAQLQLSASDDTTGGAR